MLSLHFTFHIQKSMDKQNYKWIIVGLLLISILPYSYSQRIGQRVGDIKERGPLFITSLSFSQGIARIPYTVEEGENAESVDKLGKGISNIAINQFMGYQFNPFVALGLGINFEYWTVKNGFVPIYIDLRINMMRTRIAPHMYVNLGYANRWFFDSKPYKAANGNASDYIIHGAKSGLMGELGLGMKFTFAYASDLNVTIFSKFQESTYRYYSSEDGSKPAQNVRPILVNTDRPSMYIFIGIKAGISF